MLAFALPLHVAVHYLHANKACSLLVGRDHSARVNKGAHHAQHQSMDEKRLEG
jgi:hypothetical protein